LSEGKQIELYQPLSSNQLINKNKQLKEEVLLEVKGLSVRYKKGWFKPTYFNALDNISFTLKKGESFGIIGVSGSGKSSLAKAICGIIPPYEGKITYFNPQQGGQMIFQNPYLSLNPKFNIHKILFEAIRTLKKSKEFNRHRILEVLSLVGLDESFLLKFPHECSGGEQQRIAIARAICVNPSLLILDESLASLDVDRQISMLNLLNDIQNKTDIAILFISHDMPVVYHMSNNVMVMRKGELVEKGSTEAVFLRPENEYTLRLMSIASLK
jgi:peptide/nickel transport system ATP-binding protein